jgi:AraC-like DNA-binding protein
MTDNFAVKLYSGDAPQRVGPLARIPVLLREFGVSTGAALDGTGIAPEALGDPGSAIPYRQGSTLLDQCVRLTQCAHFGLLLGARSDCRDLGLPGQLMGNAPSLEAAVLAFVGVQELNSRGASVYLHRLGQHWIWGSGIYEPAAVAQEQIYGLTVAIFCNSVRLLTGGAVKPIECIFPFRRPEDAAPYGALLGVPARFDQREAGVILPRSALDAPVAGADPAKFEHLRKLIASRLPASDKVWTERVNHAIRPLILRGQPTTASMAEMLGVNVRTLARRLESEGTTFHELLDRVRYGVARELLLITDMTVGDIADALAYAHQSSFADAFMRWSGTSPSAWRRTTMGLGTNGTAA